jgi:hypothetical protein
MRDYVTTEDGQGYQNSDGSEYDDGVMAMAIAIAAHNIEPPPAAYEMVEEHKLPRKMGPVNQTFTSGHQQPIDNQPTDVRVARPRQMPASVELVDEPLPILDDFPEDFQDDEPDEAPWEAWGQPRERKV